MDPIFSWKFDPQFWPAIIEEKYKKIEERKELDYQKIEVPIDTVAEIYAKTPVRGFKIKKVELVHNDNLLTAFETKLKKLSHNHLNPKSHPKWSTDWRLNKEFVARQSTMEKLKSISTTIPDFPHVKLAFMFHGTSYASVPGIFNSGFQTYAETDPGYFGTGIYQTSSAAYAWQYASTKKKPVLILSLVAYYSAYPIIHYPGIKEEKDWDNLDSDLKKKHWRWHTRAGKFENYDAHYAQVTHKSGITFLPPPNLGQQKMEDLYDELVIFDESQILPQFILKLTSKEPIARTLKTKAVLALRPLILAYLQHCEQEVGQGLNSLQETSLKSVEEEKISGYLQYLIGARQRKISSKIIREAEQSLLHLLPKRDYESTETIPTLVKECLQKCYRFALHKKVKIEPEFSYVSGTFIEHSLTQLFAHNSKHIIIFGSPGSGKSYLCDFIIFNWAQGQLWNQQFDAVFHLKWKDLKSLEAGKSLGHCIYKFVIRGIDRPNLQPYKIDEYLVRYRNRILFIIDDFKEINQNENTHSILEDFLITYPYWILTMDTHEKHQLEYDTSLSLKPFSSAKINQYLTDYLDTSLSHQAISFIGNNPRLMHICSHPWNLALFAEMIKNQGSVLPITSLTDIYIQVIGQKRIGDSDQIFKFLEEIAFYTFKKRSLTFSFQENEVLECYEKYGFNKENSTFKNIHKMGVLEPTHSKKTFLEINHSFIPSFQAFLAASYLADLLKNEKWYHPPWTKKGQKILEEIIFVPAYKEVILFLAGLLRHEADAVEFFIEQLKKQSKKNIYTELFRYQCLEECNQTSKTDALFLKKPSFWVDSLENERSWAHFIQFMLDMKKIDPKSSDYCQKMIEFAFSHENIKIKKRVSLACTLALPEENAEFARFLMGKMADCDDEVRINACRALPLFISGETALDAIYCIRPIITTSNVEEKVKREAVLLLGILGKFFPNEVYQLIQNATISDRLREQALIKLAIHNPSKIMDLKYYIYPKNQYSCIPNKVHWSRIHKMLDLAKAYPEAIDSLLSEAWEDECEAVSLACSMDIAVFFAISRIKHSPGKKLARLVMSDPREAFKKSFIKGVSAALVKRPHEDFPMQEILEYLCRVIGEGSLSLKKLCIKFLEDLTMVHLQQSLCLEPLVTPFLTGLNDPEIKGLTLDALRGLCHKVKHKQDAFDLMCNFLNRLVYTGNLDNKMGLIQQIPVADIFQRDKKTIEKSLTIFYQALENTSPQYKKYALEIITKEVERVAANPKRNTKTLLTCTPILVPYFQKANANNDLEVCDIAKHTLHITIQAFTNATALNRMTRDQTANLPTGEELIELKKYASGTCDSLNNDSKPRSEASVPADPLAQKYIAGGFYSGGHKYTFWGIGR